MRRCAAALVLLAACVRDTGPAPSDDLTGLTVQLAPGPVRLLTVGAVGDVAAGISFDVGSPLSTATTGCFDGPRVEGRVESKFPDGKTRQLPELTLRALKFGGHRHLPLKVGLEEGKECEVMLGLDVLAPWALEFDLGRRELKFLRSATRADYEARALAPAQAGWESHLLELTRDPQGDWPMIPVRVRQAEESLVAPFVLSTREAASRVGSEAARGAGLKSGRELFDGLTIPEGIELPDSGAITAVVASDALELSAGFGVNARSLRLDDSWQGKGLAGVLGGDVWGRFDATVDVGAGLLWLRRRQVLKSGDLERCVRGEATGEEGCYELWARPGEGGLEAAVTLWRGQPIGGRLYIDVVGPQRPPCRLGFSFGPADRGSSAHFVFPWQRLKESMPACAAAIGSATGGALALYDEGPLVQCPGTCAFAEDLLSRRVTCACDAGGELSETDRAMLELYKVLLKKELERRERASEPSDPD